MPLGNRVLPGFVPGNAKEEKAIVFRLKEKL
jgi:hypothetical protein